MHGAKTTLIRSYNTLFIVWAIFGIGCARPLTTLDKPLFGFYATPQEALPEAKAIGADLVVGAGDLAYLKAASLSGLKVIAKHTGKTLPNHPALFATYLVDEPDLLGVPPETVLRDYKAVKTKDKRPIFLNLSSAYSLESYGGGGDILSFDWYPIGWQPIQTFYAQARIARLAASGKPFFAIIQAFDWSRYPQLMPKSPKHRIPAANEVRAMTAWAAIHGATGILYYPFDDGHSRVLDEPTLRQAIKEIIVEIRANRDFFYAPKVWAPYPFRFLNTEDQYNSLSDVTIPVRFGKGADDSGWLRLVAANTTDAKVVVNIRREIELKDQSGSLVFEPFAVRYFNARLRGTDPAANPK